MVTDIVSYIDTIGDTVADSTNSVIGFLNQKGYIINDYTARIVSIFLVVSFVYLLIHFLPSIKPLVRNTLIVLAVVICASVAISTFII